MAENNPPFTENNPAPVENEQAKPENTDAPSEHKTRKRVFTQKNTEPLRHQIVFRVTDSELKEIQATIEARKKAGKITTADSGVRDYFISLHKYVRESFFSTFYTG